MNNDLPAEPSPPPKRRGKFEFLLIALAPMPIGLLMFISRASLFPLSRITFPLLGILAFGCCAYGSIGICGGYDGKSRLMPWLNGIVLGIILFVVQALIVLFVGCAVAFTGSHG